MQTCGAPLVRRNNVFAPCVQPPELSWPPPAFHFYSACNRPNYHSRCPHFILLAAA
ncbi:MAG: hypothetical protein J6C40_10410 [Lentisphaeria bacterium]|nr:hypothetical protein [Lentisphaeria bacterium]